MYTSGSHNGGNVKRWTYLSSTKL